MVGVDTNVLVRLLTRDDESQFRKVRDLFREQRVFIAKTVVLETEWVLRYAYGFAAAEIADAFEKLAGLEQVEIDAAGQIASALEWLRSGMDFADALHLAGMPSATESFVTFDRELVKTAPQDGVPARLLT